MKDLNSLVSLLACVICLGSASTVNAYSLSPINAGFNAVGTIVLKSPSSLQLAVTCTVSLSGNIDSMGVGRFTSATLNGLSALCISPQAMLIYPMVWTVTNLVSGSSAGSLEGVGYSASALGAPSSHCGPSTILVSYDNQTARLTAINQPLSGSCTVQRLDVTILGSSAGPVAAIP